MKRTPFLAVASAVGALTALSVSAQPRPLSALDRDLPPLLSLATTPGQAYEATFTLHWWGGDGRVYLGLENSFSLPEETDKSHVLREWNAALPLFLLGNDTSLSVGQQFEQQPDRAFFRLLYFDTAGVSTLCRDTDGDGVDDLDELRIGTNRTSTRDTNGDLPDTDDDQLPDDWETRNFGNLSQIADGDPDHDGIPNSLEHSARTDPNSAIVFGNQHYTYREHTWADGVLTVIMNGDGKGFLRAEFDAPGEVRTMARARLRRLWVYPDLTYVEGNLNEPYFLQATYERIDVAGGETGLLFTVGSTEWGSVPGRDLLRSIFAVPYGRRSIEMEGAPRTVRVSTQPHLDTGEIVFAGQTFTEVSRETEGAVVRVHMQGDLGHLWADYAGAVTARSLQFLRLFPAGPAGWTPDREDLDWRQAEYSRQTGDDEESYLVFTAFTTIEDENLPDLSELTGTDTLTSILGTAYLNQLAPIDGTAVLARIDSQVFITSLPLTEMQAVTVTNPGTPQQTMSPAPSELRFPAIVRDFPYASWQHPDFGFNGSAAENLVKAQLGSDGLPVFGFDDATYSSSRSIKSWASFDRWYRSTDALSLRLEVQEENKILGSDSYIYGVSSGSFYPHKYHAVGDGLFSFTTELHMLLDYNTDPDDDIPDTKFYVEADDDLWVFVDGKLAIDRGGIHVVEPLTYTLATVLPSLGQGSGTCRVDVFHAERKKDSSALKLLCTSPLRPFYNYQVTAETLADHRATFSLPLAPPGMRIDAISGKISWAPADFPSGDYAVLVEVRDRQGNADSQAFTIRLSNEP